MIEMFDYKLENGKVIRISEATIQNLMDKLELDREDAILTYLEDEGYEIEIWSGWLSELDWDGGSIGCDPDEWLRLLLSEVTAPFSAS